MTFRVKLSPSAIRDAETAYLWLKEQDREFADTWFQGFREAIISLEQLPARCPLAPESRHLEKDVRQLLYRKSKRTVYRILFGISDTEVNVYRIRHSAQQTLTEEDFDV
ncbi:type II toxin-antitoxin system RelE/ParE family toxin [Pleurocapsales cyanobacterium LEGE 10410]|nr:type II toxin-antitoxin system RelE/ParE family toxin [Pleurocapsales cyanobacterium LEGE 10410]